MPLFADSGELDGTALTLSTPLVRPGQCGTQTRCNVIDLRLARSNHSAGFLAGCLARHILKRSDFLRGRPIFSRPSGNRLHVMLSLTRGPVLFAGVERFIRHTGESALRARSARHRLERETPSSANFFVARARGVISEPFRKLTCGRVVTHVAMSGRLAPKSTPMHVFTSDSPRADHERPQVKTASSSRNEHFRCERHAAVPVFFHRETPSSFVYSDRRQRRTAGLPYSTASF